MAVKNGYLQFARLICGIVLLLVIPCIRALYEVQTWGEGKPVVIIFLLILGALSLIGVCVIDQEEIT